jgi:hypothetical protein
VSFRGSVACDCSEVLHIDGDSAQVAASLARHEEEHAAEAKRVAEEQRRAGDEEARLRYLRERAKDYKLLGAQPRKGDP